MRAMLLEKIGAALRPTERDDPVPGDGEVRLRIEACAVCRTDLHVVDGDLPNPKLPLVPGHEIVGIVDRVGAGVDASRLGRRVGVPWLGHTCGSCAYCAGGRENLCDSPVFTGYTRDGGFATHVVADAAFAFDLDPDADPVALAPLLCAGLIGWRSLQKAGDGRRIGIYGFGAAAHIIAQVAIWQGREIFAFTRPGDNEAQRFARELGATWAGGSDEQPGRAARRGDHLRTGRRPGAGGPGRGPQGRARRLRRHPHERHSRDALRAAVAGAGARVGRKSDPPRRRGVLSDRAPGGRPHAHPDLCA